MISEWAHVACKATASRIVGLRVKMVVIMARVASVRVNIFPP